MEEVDHLEDLTDQRLSAIDNQITTISNDWEEQLAAQREAIDSRFEALETALSDSESSLDPQALEDLEQAWSQRLSSLESDVCQVRQAQLAFSAQLEMLR